MSVRERPADVVVLRETELTRWLQRRTATLTPTQVQQLASLAAQPVTWRRAPETEVVDHPAFERLRAAVDRARRRRRGWALAVAATIPVAFVFAWSALLEMLTR